MESPSLITIKYKIFFGQSCSTGEDLFIVIKAGQRQTGECLEAAWHFKNAFYIRFSAKSLSYDKKKKKNTFEWTVFTNTVGHTQEVFAKNLETNIL